MIFREATTDDIAAMHVVRVAVKENVLSDPSLITHKDYQQFLFERGKGWVCEIENNIVGFAIVDVQENNIWALFVHPDSEGKGVGSGLHTLMMDWYFAQTNTTVWLGTEPESRAASFYAKAGWKLVGMHGQHELKFEMCHQDWITK